MDGFTLPKLPPRPTDAHKGTCGTLAIIGGSAGNPGTTDELRARMIGAPALVAMGANKSGCGLVKIAAPEPILNAVLTLAPMATGYPIGTNPDGTLINSNASAVLDRLATESDALVIGPGLGTTPDIQQLVLQAISLDNANRLQCVIVDADAINALCQANDFASNIHMPLVITPHPGEAQRLLDTLNIEGHPAGTDAQRQVTCANLATKLGCIVVLKGKGTIVSDGNQHWICQRGHPCLATGGTGDVLAGIIGSLAAQCAHNPKMDLLSATCIAVDIHATCGELWATKMNAQAGLDPRELCEFIPNSMPIDRSDTK